MKRKVLFFPGVLLVLFFQTYGICLASGRYTVQGGSFSNPENAGRVLHYLGGSAMDCSIRYSDKLYRVECGSFDSRSDAKVLRTRMENIGFKDVFILAEAAEVKEKGDRESPPPGTKPLTGEIFERRGGYIHPFLSFGLYYTDNLFNTRDDKKDDLMMVITPGVWVSLPRVKQRLLNIRTDNISPGGLELSLFKERFPRRYQTYLLYKADIEQFKRYSSENTVNHRVDGLFQYNFRGGLSIDLIDQFQKSHDIRGTGVTTELDKFSSNLVNLLLVYDLSEKLKLRAEYSNFLVDYDESRNDFRDRVDNGLTGYLFYRFMPKTSFFVQYEFLDIDYDEDTVSDSKEHHLFAGIQWDITAKSKGRFKAGYGDKDFSTGGDAKDFIFELQVDHQFTPKTSLKLAATRRTNETTISISDYLLSTAVRAEYLQRFTGKITGSLGLGYRNDSYRGELTFGGVTDERDDDIYNASLAFQYEFKDWLKADLGYIYTKRDSNFPDFDFTNNTLFFRITGSL